MWDLWNIVCDAIDHLGDPTSNLEQLVQMMICISKLPDVVDINGEVVKSSMNSQVCWRELPGSAFYFREVAMSKSREGEKNPIVPFLHPRQHFRGPLPPRPRLEPPNPPSGFRRDAQPRAMDPLRSPRSPHQSRRAGAPDGNVRPCCQSVDSEGGRHRVEVLRAEGEQ